MELDTASTVETTPSSRIQDEQRRLAELKGRVLATDPNHGRCIVENCDASRAIEYCHIIARNNWKDNKLVRSCGTLEGMSLIILSSRHSNGSGTCVPKL